MRIEGYGLSVDAPSGWEARIFQLTDGLPTLHAANFPLPAADGEFGPVALASMPSGGAFLTLTEYGPRLADRGLFAPRGVPRALSPRDLDPNALQRIRANQMGAQRFLTSAGRPFCLYVVVATAPAAATSLVRAIDEILATVQVGAADAVSPEQGESGSLRRV